MDSLNHIVDMDRAREYVRSHGSSAISRIIKAATNYGGVNILDELLSDGVYPNVRVVDVDDLFGVQSNFKTATTTRRIDFSDDDHWYPLYRACNHRIYAKGTTKEGFSHMISALLRHGADLYAVFRQGFYPGLFPRSIFPGVDNPVAPPRVLDDVRYDDNDDHLEYSLRSFFHAILEDGLFIKPILDFPGLTLLLSACQNLVGADALHDNTNSKPRYTTVVSRISKNPFPDSSDYLTASILAPTAIKALLDLGADPLSTDYEGKHILHHLLEAKDKTGTTRIRQSLRYFVPHFPVLVNQPDSKGTYPLHAAMQSVRRFRTARQIEISEPESSVADLIAAGADPHVRDAHGNNILHYIADLGDMERYSGLTELDWIAGEWSATTGRPAAARGVLDILLDQGVDVNARNDAGVIEKLADETEAKIFDKLGAAGVDWNERDEQGRALLHAVAVHDTMRTVWMCKYLRDRGVDPLIRDTHEKTAVDLAWGSSEVVEAM